MTAQMSGLRAATLSRVPTTDDVQRRDRDQCIAQAHQHLNAIQVTQQNAALVEEAAAKSLEDQEHQLDVAVRAFHIKALSTQSIELHSDIALQEQSSDARPRGMRGPQRIHAVLEDWLSQENTV